MSALVAALPMYDWPEVRQQTDSAWAAIRDRLRERGIAAPERLARDRTDLQGLWRDPDLLLSQTCWGPMEAGLSRQVQVLAQPDYSAYEGGDGELYSSAIVMRAEDRCGADDLEGRRFAFNSADSRSGYLALEADLKSAGRDISLFSQRIETGGHRASIRAVAHGLADVAAIDCRNWAMALRHEPAARALAVVGWTRKRKGLPYITARTTPPMVSAALREALLLAQP